MAFLDDFLTARSKQVRDFSQRMRGYHERDQAFELEKQKRGGEIEKDINIALQNLKTEGASRLQAEQQKFDEPLQAAQVKNITEEARGKDLDTSLGAYYSGGLLEDKVRMNRLFARYLRDSLGMKGLEDIQPMSENVPSAGGELPQIPLSQAKKNNLAKYHPASMLFRSARTGWNRLTGKDTSIQDYIRGLIQDYTFNPFE